MTYFEMVTAYSNHRHEVRMVQIMPVSEQKDFNPQGEEDI